MVTAGETVPGSAERSRTMSEAPHDPEEAAVVAAEARHRGAVRSVISRALLCIPPVLFAVCSVYTALVRPLWRDEYATWLFASLSPRDLLEATSHVDAVIAPYYLVSHGVLLITGDVLALRLVSVSAGLLTIVLLMLLVRNWWGVTAAVVAGTALAVNPLFFELSSTARPYAPAVLFVVCALICLDRACSPGAARWWWVGYAAGVAAAGAMHLLALLAVAGLWARLFPLTKRRLFAWALATALAGFVVFPLALAAASQSGQVSWIPRPEVRSGIGALASLTAFTADNRLTRLDAFVLLLYAGAAVVGLVLTWRIRNASSRTVELRRFAVAVAVAVLPWAFLLVESSIATPFLRTTYLAPSTIGLALLLALVARRVLDHAGSRRKRIGVGTWRRRRSQALRAAVVVAVGGGLVLSGTVTLSALREPWWTDDFPGLAAVLQSESRPGDVIVLLQHFSETGVDAGVAQTVGDGGLAALVRKRLVAGTTPEFDVRRVTSVRPFRTEEIRSAPPGRTVRIIYTRGGFGAAEARELRRLGIACASDPGDAASAERFGILRYDPSVCRAAR